MAFAGLTIGLLAPMTHAQSEEPPKEPAQEGSESGTSGEAAPEKDTDEATERAKELDSKANAAMAVAQRLSAEGRWRQAADKYAEVLKIKPDSEDARKGYQHAMTMLDDGPMLTAPTGSGMASVEQKLREQQQKTLVEFDEAYQNAQELIDEENYTGADRAILTAQIKLQKGRQYLSEGDYDRMNSKAEAMIAHIDQLRINSRLLEDEAVREEAEQSRVSSEHKSRSERERRINEALRRVRVLQMELKYSEALQVLNEILFMDPHNPSALALKDIIIQTELYRDYSDLQRRKNLSYGKEAIQQQRSMLLPHENDLPGQDRSRSGLMTYPDDWRGITLRRGVDGGYKPPAADLAVLAQIKRTRFQIDFPNIAFEGVVNFMHQVSGVKLYVDWPALELLGVDRESPIQLELAEVPMDIALDRVLEQLGEEPDHPAWAVQDGMLLISSLEALQKRKVLVVYDVRDIIMPIPDFNNAPTLDLGNFGGGGGGLGGGGQGGGQGGGFGGGGGGGGGFGGGGQGGGGQGGGGQGGGGPDYGELEDENLDKLKTIIRDNVDTEGWREYGGEVSRMEDFNKNLVITSTPHNHIEVGALLRMLREARSILINVEARFLEVDTDWYEEIGVDLDMYFNTNSDLWNRAKEADPNARLSDFFVNDGASNYQLKDAVVYGSLNQALTPDAPPYINTIDTGNAFGVPDATLTNYDYLATGVPGSPIRLGAENSGWSPIGMVQNSMNILQTIAPMTAYGDAIKALAPALGVNIQYMDDIQVDLLVKATQADSRSVALTAPRLTFYNGQQAWISVNTQESYISGLTPIVGEGSGAFQPQIGILATGFVLDVKGSVSADRRYVTMNVHFQLTKPIGSMRSVPVTGGVGAGGFGGGGGEGFGGFVELPTIITKDLWVTTSVPDKGTALLGGQRTVEEYETEVGVPILSKIPYINRFFTNRVTSTGEVTLLILLRPEIIIQTENEEVLFPGLRDEASLRGGTSSYIP